MVLKCNTFQAVCGHLRDFNLRLRAEQESHGLVFCNKEDCLDKQATLEQMESVEQFGQMEQEPKKNEGPSPSEVLSNDSSSSHPRGVLERQASMHEDTVGTPDVLTTETSDSKLPTETSDNASGLFPVCLLDNHQPCRYLLSLHSNIKTRCSAALAQHYTQVAHMPDHHFFSGYVPSNQSAHYGSSRKPVRPQRSLSVGAAGAGDVECFWPQKFSQEDEEATVDQSIEFRSDGGSVGEAVQSAWKHIVGLMQYILSQLRFWRF